ncbi:MAG: site-2 protease family protein [Paludibacteraceae bacterium]|nr:site-2 protease family protein [Paludibacteraceae bacterium]
MIQFIQLILALSFLVVIHEFGHFTFARLFGVRVERFYMFFNYKFSLIRAKRFDGKWHIRFLAPNPTPDDEWEKHPDQTEWGIGWIPFGGYCAIAGMVDETHDAGSLQQDVQPWEYRSKNVWQRLLIISGGILVNFVAALLIFALLLFYNGSSTLPLRNIDRGLYYSELLEQEGFRQQDHILTVDGQEPESLGDVVQWIIIEGKREVIVLRDNDTIRLQMSEDLGNRYLVLQNEFDRKERDKARQDPQYQKSRYVLIDYFYPFVIDSVFSATAADYAGLQAGDSIVAINEVATPCFDMVNQQLRQHPCDSITVTYFRHGEQQVVYAFIGDQCKLGVMAKSPLTFFELEHTEYTFWQSIPAGISYGWNYLKMYVKQFRLVFSKEGAQSLGGFWAIGQMFPNVWDWSVFWNMTAILSLILAFMNFLPIPGLDGGYILFILFEIITGKQPGDKFLERANTFGWVILIALLILANGNDLLKWLFM